MGAIYGLPSTRGGHRFPAFLWLHWADGAWLDEESFLLLEWFCTSAEKKLLLPTRATRATGVTGVTRATRVTRMTGATSVFHWKQANVVSALEKKGAINKTTSAEVCIHHTKPHSSPKNNVWLTDKLTIMISNEKVKTANDKTATLHLCPPWDWTGHKIWSCSSCSDCSDEKQYFFLSCRAE